MQILIVVIQMKSMNVVGYKNFQASAEMSIPYIFQPNNGKYGNWNLKISLKLSEDLNKIRK